MIEMVIAVGGALVGFLIGLGIHKKEHEMIRGDIQELKESGHKLEGRVDGHDVMFGKISVSLDYITQAVDRNYAATEELKRLRNE